MEGRTRRGDASYRRLMSAAADELIAQQGVCELAPVAARAGVSIGLPYRYFGSKGGMVAAVVGEFFDRLDALVSANLRGSPGDWITQEHSRLRAIVDFVYDEPLGPIVFARLIAEPDVVAVQRVRTARLIEVTIKAIERGKRQGVIPAQVDARVVSAMLSGGTRQVIVEAVSGKPTAPRERTKRELWRCVCRLLEIAEPAAKGRSSKRLAGRAQPRKR